MRCYAASAPCCGWAAAVARLTRLTCALAACPATNWGFHNGPQRTQRSAEPAAATAAAASASAASAGASFVVRAFAAQRAALAALSLSLSVARNEWLPAWTAARNQSLRQQQQQRAQSVCWARNGRNCERWRNSSRRRPKLLAALARTVRLCEPALPFLHRLPPLLQQPPPPPSLLLRETQWR